MSEWSALKYERIVSKTRLLFIKHSVSDMKKRLPQKHKDLEQSQCGQEQGTEGSIHFSFLKLWIYIFKHSGRAAEQKAINNYKKWDHLFFC